MKLFNTLMVILTTMFAGWVGILFAQCETQTEDESITQLCKEINRLRDLNMAYEDYYKACEELLDTLENHDNWVDRFDPMNYYDAVEQLHNRKLNVPHTYSWDAAGMMSDVIRSHRHHGCEAIVEEIKTHLPDSTLLDKYSYGF